MARRQKPLLFPADADAKGFLFIVCERFDPFPGEARFSLVAPGMDRLDVVHEELVEWLKVSLPNSSRAFDVQITEHPKTGKPEIVVPIDDTYIPAMDIADAVYRMVANYLVPFAGEQQHREVVLLRENQQLVPLTFFLANYGTRLMVTLPGSLELRQPNRPTRQHKRHSRKPEQCARDFLRHALDVALDYCDAITEVIVCPTEEGHTAVEILFSAPLLTESSTPGHVQKTILEVLSHRIEAPNDKTELVFAGTYHEDPNSRFC